MIHARAAEPFAPGPDLTGTPGLAVEVKSRRKLDLRAWIRQARRQADSAAVPLLVLRLDGMGPADVGEWVACMPLDEFLGVWDD
jgi:hypothetical protein